LARTQHYRDLLAWQSAMQLARDVYEGTEKFPQSEVFGLRMQLRRAVVSVASNIAEGHGRLTDPQLRNSLGMARGSLYEVQTQLELARDLGFIDRESWERLHALSIEVAKLINGLLRVLDK
jgi:four helix bundle protein